MKLIYIVTWLLVQSIPEIHWQEPKYGDYGETAVFPIAAVFDHNDTTAHAAAFNTRAEADSFIALAPKPFRNGYGWLLDDSAECLNLALDSVMVDTGNVFIPRTYLIDRKANP